MAIPRTHGRVCTREISSAYRRKEEYNGEEKRKMLQLKV